MSAELELRGIIPPICTPRLPGGGLDRASLRRLCEAQIAAGVNGLFVAGSSSEAALLDDATRLAALDIAVEVAAGRVPVLYGVIDMGTGRVLERARPAADHGAAAVVATVPFYMAPNDTEIRRHFAVLRQHVDLPIVAYDIPPATHVRLTPDTLVAIARAGDADGAKDSSGDLAGLRRAIDGIGDLSFPILTGSEVIADVAIAAGAAGVVPGLGNVDPGGFVDLFRLATTGDVAGAAALQTRLARLLRITEVADRARVGVTTATIGGYKAALAHRGVIESPDTFEPLGALSADERTEVGRLVDAHFAAAAAA